MDKTEVLSRQIVALSTQLESQSKFVNELTDKLIATMANVSKLECKIIQLETMLAVKR